MMGGGTHSLLSQGAQSPWGRPGIEASPRGSPLQSRQQGAPDSAGSEPS